MATSQQRDPFADVAQPIRDDEAEPEADYYATLGVVPDATSAEIHAAFRRLAKLWHPDRYASAPPRLRERAERRMRALIHAHTVLSDAVLRHEYDRRRLRRAEANAASSADAAWDPWQSAAYRSTRHAEHASNNPNGAGQLAGILAVILALGLFGGAVSGGVAANWVAAIVFGAILVLLILGAIFFTTDSPLARFANDWMESEPQPTTAQTSGWHAPDDTIYDAPYNGTAYDASPDFIEDDEDAQAFERYVDEALESVPAEFHQEMDNVYVRVEGEPDAQTLRQMCVGPHGTLFGLYSGVPLTQRGAHEVAPEIITIYRDPIERYSGYNPAHIREQVRRTVLHEVAHHFGINHEDMPDWVK